MPPKNEKRKSREAKAAPQNRRTAAPENRRSLKPTPRVPLRSRLLVLRERVRVVAARYKRAGTITGGVALTAAALAGALAVGKLVERHVHSAPAFATKLIEVRGANHLTHDEVTTAAGLALGKNVFAVSPAAAQASLLREPWIETASVRRRLPASYDLEIRERRAVALLALDNLYLVADDGDAFKQLGPGDPSDLPVITGLEPDDLDRDRRGAATVLLSAVALLHDYEDAGLSRKNPLSEIHVEQDHSLSLYVGGDPTYVRLGKAPFRTKLRRLTEVLSQLRRQDASAQYVYLDNEKRPDRVTVRLR